MNAKLRLVFRTLLGSLLCLSMLQSCNNVVESHRVAIPGYEAADYIKMLDNPDNDIVYNAISNLIYQASDFRQSVIKDSIKDTVQNKLAQVAYTKISILLTSSDEWVVCAAIRFMYIVGSNYMPKDEILNKLLTVKKLTKSTRLELICAFQSLSENNPLIVSQKAKELINDKNWLVSRFAYTLVASNNRADLVEILISKYQKTSLDYEKLLILEAIGKNYNDTVFLFFTKEIATSADPKIRVYIASILGNAKNHSKVWDWMKANVTVLNKDRTEIISKVTEEIESWSGSHLLALYIENGYDPSQLLNNDKKPLIFEALESRLNPYSNSSVLSHDDSAKLQNMRFLEQVVEKKWPGKWPTYYQAEISDKLPSELINEQKALLADYLKKAGQLFDKYKTNPKVKDEYHRNLKVAGNELLK